MIYKLPIIFSRDALYKIIYSLPYDTWLPLISIEGLNDGNKTQYIGSLKAFIRLHFGHALGYELEFSNSYHAIRKFRIPDGAIPKHIRREDILDREFYEAEQGK